MLQNSDTDIALWDHRLSWTCIFSYTVTNRASLNHRAIPYLQQVGLGALCLEQAIGTSNEPLAVKSAQPQHFSHRCPSRASRCGSLQINRHYPIPSESQIVSYRSRKLPTLSSKPQGSGSTNGEFHKRDALHVMALFWGHHLRAWTNL